MGCLGQARTKFRSQNRSQPSTGKRRAVAARRRPPPPFSARRMVAFRPALCARQRRIKHAMAAAVSHLRRATKHGQRVGYLVRRAMLHAHMRARQQAAIDPPIRSTTGINLPPSICTRRLDGFYHGRNLLSTTIGASPITGRRCVVARTAARGREGGEVEGRPRLRSWRLGDTASRGPTTIAAPKSQFRTCPSDHGKAPRNIAHDPLGITDSACKNQLVVVSVLYGPFNSYIPIRSTTIGKSRVARDPIAMHTSWRSNSDIASVTSIGYPRMKASGESSTTKHRLLHASGPHPIPPPNDPKTNQYNQDLGLIHSTNGNHLESPNEGSSIDHQVTIHLHAQNITMFPTNETWYFTSQILVSSSGCLILILTANRLGTSSE
ncbi:hypothetical protein F511_11248 [Dorcoceras hygrometricum]|uniref:Uncharacterized protein n=1 Tax=Dorcoceras hygrometricum TaxID=472368 RepID=A0A2Z7BTJ2_9LAMI|nr:hypothetical protein F511_11248 [Dorcoceras hygrometricum]